MKNISLKTKFLSNTSWLMAQNIYSMLISLIIGSLSARYLGPSNYGLIGYATSLVSLFTNVSKLGLDSVVINEMVTNPQKKGDYIGAALFMRLIASIISVICIVIIVKIIEPGDTLLLKVTFLQSISIVLQIHEVFDYWFQSELKSKYFVIATMCGLTATAIWRINLLRIGSSVEWFALSTTVQALFILIIVLIIYKKMNNSKVRIKLCDMKYLISKSHHFIIANLAITIYMQIDKIMLGKMSDQVIVGLYTAATTIAGLWQFIPIAIINSSRPLIIIDRDRDYKKYIRKCQYLFLVTTLIGILASICIFIFGKLLIIILYGKEYLSAVGILNILIWSTSLAVLGTARSVWLVAENLNKYQKNMVIMGAIVNTIFNSIAIPHFGMTGAAISTLMSQIVVQFIAPLCFKETKVFIKIYIESFKLINEFFIKEK